VGLVNTVTPQPVTSSAPCPRCGNEVTLPHVFCSQACRDLAVRFVVVNRPAIIEDPKHPLRLEVARLHDASDLVAMRGQAY
jgi:predicted RNA-binding Zn-ribbon protein involved in translation (DUF1610 family)